MYRQGELLIIKANREEILESVFDTPKKLDHRILAEGEVTGHMHELTKGTLYSGMWGKLFADIESLALLTHPEHKTIKLEKGFYEIITQREYNPDGDRRVID